MEHLGMGLVPPARRNFMFLRTRSDVRAKVQDNDVIVPPDEVLDAMHEDLLESGGVFTPKERKVGRPRTRPLREEVGGIREAKPRGRRKSVPHEPSEAPKLPESPSPPDLEDFEAEA